MHINHFYAKICDVQHEDNENIIVLGQSELIDFPELGASSVPARIDTGARTSSVWVSNIQEDDDKLTFVLFGPDSDYYTGKKITVTRYDQTVVVSSNGVPEVRFKVILSIKIKGRRIKAKFTLTDRSSQVYPILIGRSMLRGKFVVDVKSKAILKKQEKIRTAKLKRLLNSQEV